MRTLVLPSLAYRVHGGPRHRGAVAGLGRAPERPCANRASPSLIVGYLGVRGRSGVRTGPRAAQGAAIAPGLPVSQALRYGGHDVGVCSCYRAAYVLLRMGDPQQALQRVQEAVALAREIGHFGTVAIALVSASGEHLECGKAETAGALADALVRSLRGAWPEVAHHPLEGSASLEFGWSDLTAKMEAPGCAMRLTRSRA
jgi:hypothetical protein